MSVTFGPSGTPNSLTLNFDSIFSTSLANAKKRLTDQISNSNPFWYECKKNGSYESADGGAYIQEDLMYALTAADSYDSYDTLNTTPPEGITAALFDWRQFAVPISISEKEKKMNKHRLVDFLAARFKQAELGAIDFMSKSLIQGNLGNGGSLYSPRVSTSNGSKTLDPIWLFLQKDPTVGSQTYSNPGGIDQSVATNNWWRNRTKNFTGITTYVQFLMYVDNLMNSCSIGPGGRPKLIICDQTTHELWNAAYYANYRRTAETDNDYPFENILYKGAHVVWDESFPNIGANTLDTTTTEGGGIACINTDFLRIRYESDTDFANTEMVRPADQDAKVAHTLWMGNTTTNQRRKSGVGYNIPRSLV